MWTFLRVVRVILDDISCCGDVLRVVRLWCWRHPNDIECRLWRASVNALLQKEKIIVNLKNLVCRVIFLQRSLGDANAAVASRWNFVLWYLQDIFEIIQLWSWSYFIFDSYELDEMSSRADVCKYIFSLYKFYEKNYIIHISNDIWQIYSSHKKYIISRKIYKIHIFRMDLFFVEEFDYRRVPTSPLLSDPDPTLLYQSPQRFTRHKNIV